MRKILIDMNKVFIVDCDVNIILKNHELKWIASLAGKTVNVSRNTKQIKNIC